MSKEDLPGREIESGSMVGRVTGLGFSTYDRVLFEDLTFNIRSSEVTAITGKSGSGKTVILRILAGAEIPEAGAVDIQTREISFVPQELDDLEVNPDTDIRKLFKDARGLTELGTRIAEYEQQFAEDPGVYEQIAIDYGEALDVFRKLNGYHPEPEMNRVLAGLGVDEYSTGNITLDTKLNEISSGQLRRVMIACALYSRPHLLILDDPTSHLDVVSVKWLSNYLKTTRSAVIIASNNRGFVDACATQTIGLTDIGRVFVFSGGYSEFEQKRDAVIKAEEDAAESVAKKREQLRETDKMFRAKQAYSRSANMAQVGRALETRIKKLQKQYEEMPGSQDVFRDEGARDLVFQEERRSGNDVVFIHGVVKKYGEHIAVDMRKNPPITISRGEKWLVWGDNGSGKSTLVRMIANESLGENFTPDEGELSVGASVDMAYFAPDVMGISRRGLLIEETTSVIGNLNKGRATAVLRFFGFSGAAAYNQDVRTLSSGEKKRLALAKIMLQNPNLIILDEPTGDYMPDKIKERLASALRGYDGTLILVSHDIDFIDQLDINKEIVMHQGRVKTKK
jgi:ATP-binding cassette, subfamily F, member 3